MLIKWHFSPHSGHISGGVAAVMVKPQCEHFQYVRPHCGQMSPSNLPSLVKPQREQTHFSCFSFISSPSLVEIIFTLARTNDQNVLLFILSSMHFHIGDNSVRSTIYRTDGEFLSCIPGRHSNHTLTF